MEFKKVLGYFKKHESSASLNLNFPFSIDSISSNRCHIQSESKVFSNDNYQIIVLGKFTKLFIENFDLSDFRDKQEELVARLFDIHGQEVGRFIDGHYLLIIFLRNKDQCFIINNRYQTTQLYYYEDDKHLIFGSKLKDVLTNLPIKYSVNKNAIRSFLANGFTWTDQTQIENVRKLLPTHRIEIKDDIQLKNTWDEEFDFKREPFADLQTHLDSYEHNYQDGIKNIIDAYQPNEVGTLLSGGHDTSFTLIQAAKVFKKPIHTFTVTFPSWEFDEGLYAENISKKFSAIHHPCPFTPKGIDAVVDLIRACDEPVVGSTVALHHLANEAKGHVDLMLCGDGGDTLWAEYHPVAEIHKYIKNLPRGAVRFLHKATNLFGKLTNWERFWELEHVLKLFDEENPYHHFMTRLCTYRHFDDEYQRKLLTNDFYENSTYASCSHEIKFTKENFDEALIEGKLFNAFYTYQMFSQTKSIQHFGIPYHAPNLTRENMRFITRLPREWVNGGTTFHRLTNNKTTNRKFHKMALSRYLPREEIYNRSFDMPWFKVFKPRHKLLKILQNRLKNRGWYDEQYIDKLFTDFSNFKNKDHEMLELKDNGYRIFTLLSLEVWSQEYLDQKFTENAGLDFDLENYL